MTNFITIDDEEERRVDPLDLQPNATSLDLIRAVYRDPSKDLYIRLRAAGMAICYEHPRIQVVAQVTGEGLAELLDARLKRLAEAKQIEPQPQPQPQLQLRLQQPQLSERQ